MFRTRLISGILLAVAALVTIGCGGIVLLLTLLCVSVIGVHELYQAMKVMEKPFEPLEMTGYAAVFFIYGAAALDFSRFGMFALTGGLILMLFVYVFTYPRYHAGQVMAAFFGVVYVGEMLSFIYLLREMEPAGKYLVWLVFICSWGCDTCAYCVGKLIGRHKMTPILSPKKSVEGAIGGVAGSALLGAGFAALTGASGIWQTALICAVGGLISMVGDLAASAIKRNQNIKDYGKLIPGHGGILDRFDSVIITAPMIYYLVQFLTAAGSALE